MNRFDRKKSRIAGIGGEIPFFGFPDDSNIRAEKDWEIDFD